MNYLRPTPIDAELEIRGVIKELKEKKVVVSATVSAKGKLCATGEVVAVRMPENMLR